MIRPTDRAIVLAVAALAVSTGLAVSVPDLWAVGPVVLLIVLLAVALDAILAARRSEIDLRITVPAALAVGSEGEGALTVGFGTHDGAVRLRVQADVSGGLQPIPSIAAIVPRAGSRRMPFALRADRRGTGRIDAIHLIWEGPFGLASRIATQMREDAVRIVPDIGAVRDLALSVRLKDMVQGLKPQSFTGDGSEFQALREFANGMDPRTIDWVRSARYRKLISKEFEAERNHTIVMAYDLGRTMSEPIAGLTRLDHAINAGLLMGYMALRGGDRVGVFGFDSKVRAYCPPIQGVHAMPYVQAAVAELAYGEEETNFTLGLAELSARLNRRALIVLMTDFTDSISAELMLENVARLARRHLVIFVTLSDPDLVNAFEREPESLSDVTEAVVAEEFLKERRIVLERLRRLGVDVLDCPRDGMAPHLIARYLDIKARTRM